MDRRRAEGRGSEISEEASRRREGSRKKLSWTEVYQILVIELGLSPQYVLDEMDIYEMRPLLEKSYLKSRESWEQTRLMYGMFHKAWFKGDPKEMRFPWDTGKTSQAVTKKQADELFMKMKAEEQKMKKKNG